ncbi:ABC transporter permease [Periweissella fabalis]|uniref:FtsX-like permease family protein n=1 Tax=Periweissella fabalis TaxID=1070421 RepID=A0A7X6N3J1_9LACO|nr:ABC transporter permease [Periweissella fabalis]NKZ25048.1 FtsX-like permease family protein [Periweissella fabalis]
MLGIVIGISSVITILSLGNGFQKYTIKNLTQTSSKAVNVEIDFSPNDFGLIQNYFNELDLHLVESVPGVSKANYNKAKETNIMQTFQFQNGKYTKAIMLGKSSQSPIICGRNFTLMDSNSLSKVAIISKDTAEEISKNFKDVLGYGLPINGEFYEVIGIVNNSTFGDIEIPQKTYQYYNTQKNNISSIDIAVKSGYKPSKVANAVVKKLTQDGSMATQGTYSTLDMSSILDGVSKILSTLTFFISGVAGISLLIAGVGVMNMMYTSVSERTQEIGVRRAMGATRGDIRKQFMAEGLVLTVSSGLIGYAIGFLVAFIISQFLPFKVSPTLFTISIAVGTTTILGLLFSIAPANLAARKDLVDILR